MTVFVVEDEPPILRDLVASIESADRNWTVVGTARDGRSALDAIKQAPVPDLIITDIRMPIMDGLQFVEQLRKDFPQPAVLILSGYQEFEYARKAVSLSVRDYLLKPYTKANLVAALDRVEASLVVEREAASRIRLEKALHGSSFLANQDEAQRVGLATLIAGTVTDPSYSGDLLGAVLWDGFDLESRVRDALQGCPFWILEGWNPAEQLVVWDTSGPERAPLERSFEVLHKSFLSEAVPVVVVVERSDFPLSALREAYARHRKFVAERCRPGESALLSWDGQAQQTDLEVTRSTTAQETLVARALAHRSPELLVAALGSIVSDWDRARLSQLKVKRSMGVLMARLSETWTPSDGEGLLASVRDLPRLVEPWTDLLLERTQLPDETVDESLVVAARTYIEEHYLEDLTGEELSRRIGLGPSYLSKLFRANVGRSPHEHIVHLRMQQAQKILESGSAVLIKDVAEAVGYRDSGHFSRIFKRVVGMWPTEFRKH